MASSFIEQLRQNNLFTDQNPNPLQPPNMNTFDPSSTFRNLFPLVAGERQKDRDLQLQLARMRQPQLGNIGRSMMQPEQPPPNVVFDRRGDSADEFARDILNPPERGFKFQQLRQKRDIAEEGLDVKRGDQQIRQQRADVYDFKAKNPSMKFAFPKGGNILAINPLTGETHDTGMSTGTMTEEDKQYLLGEQKQQEIGSRGAEAANVANIRNRGALEAVKARGEQTRQTNEAKPTKELLPTQQRAAQTNAARQLANTDPDLGKFVNINPDGTFNIEQPGTSFFGRPTGPTLDQFKQIQDKIYGTPKSEKDIKLPADEKKPTKNDEKVMVTKDGKKFNLPKSQLDDAVKQGYSLVK